MLKRLSFFTNQKNPVGDRERLGLKGNFAPILQNTKRMIITIPKPNYCVLTICGDITIPT